MKCESKGLCEAFIRMIDSHAEINDNDFVGQIILFALGINGFCAGFCKCKYGGYNLYWWVDGNEYLHTFSKEEIENALYENDFEYKIEITRR